LFLRTGLRKLNYKQKNSMDKNQYISKLNVNKANFLHIAETGVINGTLLHDLQRMIGEVRDDASTDCHLRLAKSNIESCAEIDSLQKEREELIVKVKDLEEQVESEYQTNLELGKDCRRLCDELHEAKKERDQLILELEKVRKENNEIPDDVAFKTLLESNEYLGRDIESLKTEINQLNKETKNLRTVMVAAAEEIQSHWQAHCDEEGYGPANLMHRLEKGIAASYPGYTPGQFEKLRKERDQLKETAERMKEFLIYRIRNSYISIENGGCEVYPFDSFDTHQIEGMKRAYQDVLSEFSKAKELITKHS